MKALTVPRICLQEFIEGPKSNIFIEHVSTEYVGPQLFFDARPVRGPR